MRYITETRRVGEYLGPVDWSYDFRQHFDNYSCPVEIRDNLCAIATGRLRQLSEGEWEATTDGGSPKFGWHKVIQVGMYDGWPYWRPIPSFCSMGPLGPEWHFFYEITGIQKS